MSDRRLEILLDAEQHDRVVLAARARGVSVATIVREAINLSFPATKPTRRAAGEAVLAAEPMPAPDIPDLLAELDQLRGRRG